MEFCETEKEQFQTAGLVTLSPGFAEGAVEAANDVISSLDCGDFVSQAHDDSSGWYKGSVLQPELLRIVYDAFFENVSKAVLRAEAVELAFVSLRVTRARPDANFELEPEHVDFKCGNAAVRTSPVAMPSSFFVWLTDVRTDNCPLHYRPGSHLQVMDYMDRYPDDNNDEIKQDPPDLDYADPTPVLATCGQASLVSGTVVHGGSVTPGHRERRLLVVEYKAKGVDFPMYAQLEERRAKHLQQLKAHFPKDRLHLLPD